MSFWKGFKEGLTFIGVSELFNKIKRWMDPLDEENMAQYEKDLAHVRAKILPALIDKRNKTSLSLDSLVQFSNILQRYQDVPEARNVMRQTQQEIHAAQKQLESENKDVVAAESGHADDLTKLSKKAGYELDSYLDYGPRISYKKTNKPQPEEPNKIKSLLDNLSKPTRGGMNGKF